LAITGQAKRRRIVINADAYISGATSNFPVLVKFNSTSHPDLFATGDDKDSVWFSSDASGQTTLYHEGVVFSATDAIFYVRVDLSSTADTVIYFWYGTPSITGTESINNTWYAGYSIHHFQDTLASSISGGYSFSMAGSLSYSSNGVSGKALTGWSSSNYLTASSCGTIFNKSYFTSKDNSVIVMAKSAASGVTFYGGNTSGNGRGPKMYSRGATSLYCLSDYYYAAVNPGEQSTTDWVLAMNALDGATVRAYIYDAVTGYKTASTTTKTYYSHSDRGIIVGRCHAPSNLGSSDLIDFIWVFTEDKSADYFKAVYNNHINYSTFITIDGSVSIGSSPKMVVPVWPTTTQEDYSESVSCGIGVSAAVAKQTDYHRAVTCGIGVGISTDAANVEVIEVGVGISAAVTTQANYSRTVNCGIGVAAAVGRVQELTQAISCGVGVAASVSKQANFHRSVSCGIGVAIGTQKEIGKTISCGIGVSATVTYQVYTDQDNFNIEKITVSKNIQDAMWQSTIQIDGTTVPPYYRHLRLYMKDHTDTDQLVFVGFLPSADYTLVAAGNKTTMTAYDYGWYLSSQYVPNSLRITDEDTNPADTIKAILGGSTWEKETGIEPYKIDDVSGWGTTVTKKSFVFDKKTTKKQAIDEICSHCNFIFVLKWRITSGGHSRPCAYFINEDDIDTDLDLPSKATFASGNAYLLGNVKVEDRQNEKINRVRVAGANPITGDWYEAVVESVGVTSGDEIPIEYYFESSSLDTQEKVDDKAQALFDFFNTVAKTYTATLLNRTDLRLYQKIQFTGYSKIDSDEMRIIGISYADLGTHREVTVQFTSDQSLSDLKALNRSMGGDIYNNTTNILNHYFIDLTKIAVGTITAIDGNTATVELEDGSGFVKARLINQNE